MTEGDKTFYVVLYDSVLTDLNSGGLDLNADSGADAVLKSRYHDTAGNPYLYSVEFFEEYFKILGTQKTAFLLSVRDVDFDQDVTGYQEFSGAENPTQQRFNNVANITADRYRKIMENMQTALENVNQNRVHRVPQPEVYIGTPHSGFWVDRIASANPDPNVSAENFYLAKYMEVTRSIYNQLEGNYGDWITGIYYGKEDPEACYNPDGTYTMTMRNRVDVAKFARSKGKKILWSPYSTNEEEWKNICEAVDQGRYEENGVPYDLFDIVMIQPGMFFSNYGMTNDDEWLETKGNNLHKSCAEQRMYCGNGVPYGGKITETQIIFQIEYDISLVTGRWHEDKRGDYEQVYSITKADNFIRTLEKFQDLIYDEYTSFGIYAGGPNEQNYAELPLENANIHSLYNHPSALAISKKNRTIINGDQEQDGSWIDYRFPYYTFPDRLGAENYYRIYDGQLLWNMTKYLLADNTNGAAVWSLKILLRGY